MHTCRPLKDHTSTITVQAGWHERIDHGVVVRTPIWKRHTTKWGDVVCGYHAREVDQNCPESCPGKNWKK